MTRVKGDNVNRRAITRRSLAAALALAALVICTDSASAATKDFAMTVAPGSVPAGRLIDMTATLTNLTAQQQLGSANVTPPPGFAAVSVTSLSRPAPATATIVGGVVQLRQLSLPPQQSVTVSLKVSTPCSVGTSPNWDVVAKQANDFSGLPGNSLTIDPASSSLATTTIGACAPCPENQSCTTNLNGATGSSEAVNANPSASQVDAGVLTMSRVDSIDCADYVERSPDTFRVDGPQNRPKFGMLTYSAATAPVTSKYPLDVCYASPLIFAPKPKTTLTVTFIDGELNYVGRLPNCTGQTPPPCVTGRDDATRTIAFSMPVGDPRNM
jgi:hypothetical protein